MTSVPKRVYSNRRNVNIGGGVDKAGLPGSVGISVMLRRSVAKRAPDGAKQANVPSREPRIVGEIYDNEIDESFAAYWTDTYSNPIFLKMNNTDLYSSATDINDNDIIVGTVRDVSTNDIAVYWNDVNNTYNRLNDDSLDDSNALGINNSNKVVGYIRNNNAYTPCIWNSLISDPTLLSVTINGDTTEYNGGEASDINNKGNIVGHLYYYDGNSINNQTPVYWETPTSQPENIQSLVTDAVYAKTINDNGVIYGSGLSTNKLFKWASYNNAPTEITEMPFIYRMNNKSNVVSYSEDRNNNIPTYYKSSTSEANQLRLTIDGTTYTTGKAYGLTN